jgi:hypothetical protein
MIDFASKDKSSAPRTVIEHVRTVIEPLSVLHRFRRQWSINLHFLAQCYMGDCSNDEELQTFREYEPFQNLIFGVVRMNKTKRSNGTFNKTPWDKVRGMCVLDSGPRLHVPAYAGESIRLQEDRRAKQSRRALKSIRLNLFYMQDDTLTI